MKAPTGHPGSLVTTLAAVAIASVALLAFAGVAALGGDMFTLIAVAIAVM